MGRGEGLTANLMSYNSYNRRSVKPPKSTLSLILRFVGGLLLIGAGVALGVYLGLVVLFVGGLIQAIHGIQSTPVDASAIVWGLVKAFILASPCGWLSFVALVTPGAALVASAE